MVMCYHLNSLRKLSFSGFHQKRTRKLESHIKSQTKVVLSATLKKSVKKYARVPSRRRPPLRHQRRIKLSETVLT